MDLTSPSQIADLLERHSFHFSKAFGQNFLINAAIPKKIAESALLSDEISVLEIGPGIGCLTRELATRAKSVFSVEIDGRLLPLLDETLAEFGNVTVVHGDVLKTDLNALLKNEKRLAVCANLPYNVTTPILTSLFESGLPFETITVMVQKEVAQRFCAKKGSKDYGAITLFLNYHAKPEYLFTVSSGNFMPRPRVDSAVIRFRAVPPPVATPKDPLFRVIRAAFSMRRKTLPNTLASIGVEKSDTVAALNAVGLPETTRGEELDLTLYAALTDFFLDRGILH